MTDGADGGEQAQRAAALLRAFFEAREGGDAELIEKAALNLPSGQRFGTHPGQIPALLHLDAALLARWGPDSFGERLSLAALAGESGSARIAFFASSRRAMHALVTADLATADQLIARAARLRAERDALLHEVGSAAGLGGRRRRFSSADERARVAVRKAISATLARIGQHDAALARLLSDGVRTGWACRYDPDPARPVTWVLKSTESPQATV